MIMKLLLATAAAATLALPATAQELGAAGNPATEPGGSMYGPSTSTAAAKAARTGVAADTAARVSETDLAIGGTVKDSAGMDIGKISKIGKSGGQTIVTLSANGKTAEVPASSLMKSGGALVSSESKAQVWSPK
jgi:hypothetical protein